jgi:hypothetical protein
LRARVSLGWASVDRLAAEENLTTAVRSLRRAGARTPEAIGAFYECSFRCDRVSAALREAAEALRKNGSAD